MAHSHTIAKSMAPRGRARSSAVAALLLAGTAGATESQLAFTASCVAETTAFVCTAAQWAQGAGELEKLSTARNIPPALARAREGDAVVRHAAHESFTATIHHHHHHHHHHHCPFQSARAR